MLTVYCIAVVVTEMYKACFRFDLFIIGALQRGSE
jgi:hypothetical protein